MAPTPRWCCPKQVLVHSASKQSCFVPHSGFNEHLVRRPDALSDPGVATLWSRCCVDLFSPVRSTLTAGPPCSTKLRFAWYNSLLSAK